MTELSKMKVSLDDLALFLAIANAGGLAGAARSTKVSQPTLSRRMQRLEADLGKRLFHRGARGYALTTDGRALLPLARGVADRASDVARWASAPDTPRPVRISAGNWTALWIATHLPPLDNAPWFPEFVTADTRLDIARREVDIGIRNARPDQSWLAGRPMREIRSAVYARDSSVQGWILAGSETNPTPSARWVLAHHGDALCARTNDPRLAAQLAARGAGRVVLPVFAATLVPGLVRVSDDIPALTHREWLVSHHDTRHDAPVRAALDVLEAVLSKTLHSG